MKQDSFIILSKRDKELEIPFSESEIRPRSPEKRWMGITFSYVPRID